MLSLPALGAVEFISTFPAQVIVELTINPGVAQLHHAPVHVGPFCRVILLHKECCDNAAVFVHGVFFDPHAFAANQLDQAVECSIAPVLVTFGGIDGVEPGPLPELSPLKSGQYWEVRYQTGAYLCFEVKPLGH